MTFRRRGARSHGKRKMSALLGQVYSAVGKLLGSENIAALKVAST